MMNAKVCIKYLLFTFNVMFWVSFTFYFFLRLSVVGKMGTITYKKTNATKKHQYERDLIQYLYQLEQNAYFCSLLRNIDLIIQLLYYF